MNDNLPMYVITAGPSDHPGKFVVRRWVAFPEPAADPEPTAVVDTLAAARASVPAGLARLGRHPTEDAVIVETWI